jgi:hypothetical protein
MWIVVVVSAIWVYFDAKNIGVRKELGSGFFNAGPGGWCAVTLLLWIIGFPAYLIKRGSYKVAVAALQSASLNTKPSIATEHDAIAGLEKLASLRDRGILTQAEFDEKKRQMLAI